MHNFMDAKLLAKQLRLALANQGIDRSHSECLELVARQFGMKDWNQLSARIAAVAGRSTADNPLMPRDWRITRQTDRSVYKIGLDDCAPGVVLIASRFGREDGITLEADSFGVIMQSVESARYRGRRLAFEAMISTEDADAASIWMRVDQSLGHVVRFDNMLDRNDDGALRGTHDWTIRRVVLDVPEHASSIHYGLLLKGFGAMRAQKLTVGEAPEAWPVTAGGSRLLAIPSNLDFASAA